MNKRVNIKKIIRETISSMLEESMFNSDKEMIDVRFKLLDILTKHTNLHNSDEIVSELSSMITNERVKEYLEQVMDTGKSHTFIEKMVKYFGSRTLCGINGHNKKVAFHNFVTNRGGDAIIVSQDFVRYIPRTEKVNLSYINKDGVYVGGGQSAMLYPTSKDEVFVEIGRDELYPLFNAEIVGDNIQISDITRTFEIEHVLFAEVNGIVSCLNFAQEDVFPRVESDKVIAMFNY